jgi:hypothetical protein
MGVQFRQGDVLFERIEDLPEETMPMAGDVLFIGEQSGHAHRLESVATAELFEGRAGMFMRVTAPTAVVHEEHRPILFEPGLYRVWRQREYRPGGPGAVQD